MYKLGCLLLCILANLCNAEAAHVSGFIKNAVQGESIAIEVPQFYLNHRTIHFNSEIDGQSGFSLDVKIGTPGLVFLVYNNDRLPVFLSNEDTLFVKTDAFQFPVVVMFGGKSAADNRVLQAHLKQNQLDYNEFNNIRYKIGQTWIAVEDPMNGRMENLSPDLFRSAMDAQKAVSFALLEEANVQNPGSLSNSFQQWLSSEITYNWAYHLLVYGQVFAVRYQIQPEFFDFMYEASIVSEQINSNWYQQFLLAFMARQQLKTGQLDNFWAGQYELSAKYLIGEPLAFFRSELIASALSVENFHETLPLYKDFLQKNPFPLYDEKIEGLYQKYSRVSAGAVAPAFSTVDNEGKSLELSQFQGKIVYLNFWASWCGACLRKMEFMNEFEYELKSNNIEIINVSIDENPNAWQSALQSQVFRGHHVLSTANNLNIAEMYGVEAIPQYFIIGKTGLFENKPAGNQPNDIRQQLLDIHQKGQ